MILKTKKVMRCGIGVLGLAIVSACGGGSSGPTFSQTQTISGTTVPVTLSNEVNRSVSDARVGLVAMVAGLNTSGAGSAAAISGIRRNPTVGAVQTSGGAVYNASYRAVGVYNVQRTSSTISGVPFFTTTARPITVFANFDSGTLRGQDGLIDVRGTISGSSLGGNVVVEVPNTSLSSTRSLDAPLAGEIGRDGVIGAFAGSDDRATVAGGFVGTPR